MDPDNFQQAWQAHSSETRITVDGDLLLKAVQRNRQELQTAISFVDFFTIGNSLLMLAVWIVMGVTMTSLWTWYLMLPVYLWELGFTLAVRARHKPKPSEPGEPLLVGVKESLALVEHQIWHTRSVFWWAHLPAAIAMLAFFTHVFWSGLALAPPQGWAETLIVVGSFVFLVAVVSSVYASTYLLNRQVVRTQLEPRHQEWLKLLASLEDETAHEVTGEYPMLMGAKRVPFSPRRMVIAGLCALAILLIGIPGVLYLGYRLEEHFDPKKSPFAAVRWQESQPEVKVGEEWFKLVSLDGLPASDIVAFSRRTYHDLWQKRFEKDLVEVLTGMGHEPGETVRLVVMPVGSQETRTLEGVRMTTANHKAIRNAAQAREDIARDQPTRSSPHLDDAEAPFTKLIVGLRKEKDLVGLAAMVMVDGQVIASAADGERKIGSGVWLEKDDRWHLGGITKSITATMIARLVESGRMNWSETVGERFPGATLHEDWKPVTLKQLLTDTAGAPVNFSREVMLNKPALGSESTAARRMAVLNVLAAKPKFPPGRKFAYSNVGYTIAGAMAEAATEVRWEDLVKREVFEPLELTEAGFGPPRSGDDTLEQPRGHKVYANRKFPADDQTGNTPIIAPAATVHMTLSDLCTYATEHLRGELGRGQLLSAETYKFLHTPALNQYAYGWLKKEPDAEIPHTLYWHNGTNTLWYALVVFIPAKNMVVAVTSNDGDRDKAEAAAWDVVKDRVMGVQRAIP